MDQMVEVIQGVYAIVDDILVAGKTIEGHDKIVR
jgi:adenine/guanine phosphoribosyltransferase-like PRPP-binding protein